MVSNSNRKEGSVLLRHSQKVTQLLSNDLSKEEKQIFKNIYIRTDLLSFIPEIICSCIMNA